MDDSGNPEIFYVSDIPIEGAEGLCPYLSYWSQAEVGSDAYGDYMYGPNYSKLYITEEEEFYELSAGGGQQEGDSSLLEYPSEEPIWYQFIVNEDDVGSWAVVLSYDESMQEFYLWTAADDICQLGIDYSGEITQTSYTVSVSDCPKCRCSYPAEYGWTSSEVTFNEDGPISMVGPFGFDWEFMDTEEFESDYEEYFQ